MAFPVDNTAVAGVNSQTHKSATNTDTRSSAADSTTSNSTTTSPDSTTSADSTPEQACRPELVGNNSYTALVRKPYG